MGEIFGQIPMDDMRLKKYAEKRAQELTVEGEVPVRQLGREISWHLSQLERCRHRLSKWGEGNEQLPTSAEWILDNAYLALREGRDALAAFEGRGRVRQSQQGAIVTCCARGAVFAVPTLEERRLSLYLHSFQAVCPLTQQEISLFVPALAAALVEQLDTLCGDGTAVMEDRVTGESLGLIFQGLRGIHVGEWGAFLERHSTIEQILRRDPAGIYPLMEESTRQSYREALCRQARHQGKSESEYGEELLRRAEENGGRHVGYDLLKKPRGETLTHRHGGLYGGTMAILTASIVLWAALTLKSGLLAILLAFPIFDLVKNCVDFCVVRLTTPRRICGMALEEGIPKEGRTLCVIASLLTGEGSGEGLARQLEHYYLANRDSGEELRLGLLADLADSATPLSNEASNWVERARREMDALNNKYGTRFYLFFRRPAFSPVDEVYRGWERKRGALLELSRLLVGKETGVRVLAGEGDWLKDVRYLITLDSDTSLTVGAARELVGAMLHPLNRPVLDEKSRTVVEGYGLLQPRVSVGLNSANRTLFSRIFGGQGGIDPYGSTASEVYHDLFDGGSYTGKGIFDVALFVTCLDGRFPEDTVLSHDLLEGAYLRCGLLSQVELTDGFPGGVQGYFLRLHRWVRGDWQLLPWLRATVPDGRGGRESNPLSWFNRWKIFDNLRRSLSPVFTLTALVLGICFSDLVFAVAGGVAVLAALSQLLLSGVEMTARRGVSTHVRYHSTIIPGLAGTILQTVLQLLLLPYQAYISLSGASMAIYRTCVSHKNCLQWVTAAQTEGRGETLPCYFKSQWSAVLVGAVTLLGADVRFGGLVGICWMLSPALSWYLSQKTAKHPTLTQGERTFLLHQASLIWAYFDQFLGEDDHFLPPDNWQEQPSVGVAHRTSPTNIGMALLSILSAVDLKLTDRARGIWLIERMMDSLEKMEKWRGHLYNWYDTQSLSPLSPRYVSTVDSGNFCGCLIALEQALREWGEQTLSQRVAVLAENMEFSPLYDKNKKLFSIGWEEEHGRLTQGWYDLMASEARQTSYIAVARGEVPPRHWRRLGRMQVGENDYRGMASWTGTMFEYFMPNLLLPCEENSLMYESLCFCVYAQRRRGREMNTPWGISESGFYAFDSAMNYQYKAHGVQALGLKRGLNDERVLAPYATFLALLIAPRQGVENLRHLRNLGAEGMFGLYEAVDFTASRQEGDAPFSLVRSYMSHHLGMSLVAIDNVLESHIMQRRFMKNGQMEAFRELLQERVPVGVPIFKLRHGERQELKRRNSPAPLQRSGEGGHRLTPNCHLLSSGNYAVLCCDSGFTQSKLGDCTITRSQFGRWYSPSGMSVFFLGGEHRMGLTTAPLYQSDVAYRWEFYGEGASWHSQRGGLSGHIHLTVPPGENGEIRQISLRWDGEEEIEGELLLYLEPVLAKEQDFNAHPAFSKLFLESIPVQGGVIFRRRPRGREQSPVLAVLWEGAEISFTTAREQGLGRGGLRSVCSRNGGELDGASGAQTDPCLMLRLPVVLRAGEEQSLRIVLSVSDHMESALEGARRMMEGRVGNNERLSALAHQMGLEERGVREAMSLLGQLVALTREHSCPQSDLWQFGVSGDLPIALAVVEEENSFCAQHQLLTRSGYPFDLVLVVEEGGDYRQPRATALRESLKEMGGESALGAKGGIHILTGGTELFQRWGCVMLPLVERAIQEEGTPPPPTRISGEEISWHYDGDNRFVMNVGQSLPPLGWSQILCNAHFGWVTDETGGGFLWEGNAREGRLTPWENDPLAIGGEERIVLQLGGQSYSIFADGDGHDCQVIYDFGMATWRKTIGGEQLQTVAFVPHDSNRRILTVSWSGGQATLLHRQGEGKQTAVALTRTAPVTLETVQEDGKAVTRVLVENCPSGEATRQWWRARVCPLTVATPDQGLNHYLNGWGLYQVLACRLFARTSQYQNGGAYGFRDQLQDVCALLYTAPEQARRQLLRAGSRQFEEGDVQHWWHPPLGAGVRTRITDDLLWLPYVLARYVEVTGEEEICQVELPYLTSEPLGQGEQERYEIPRNSCKADSLYLHCCTAIQCFLERGLGAHGLPLMGAGDWNDGMNRVGARGRGESLWLSWFGALVLQKFAPICEKMGEHQRASELRTQAQRLIRGAEQNWDGAWHRRGYFDDGSPLGSSGNDQCAIDSLAQSFAALVEGSDRQRAKQGVLSAVEHLYLEEAAVVRLFTPPFTGHGRDPGYIRGYLPGVRENGGQYTHGAVWLALACLRLGERERGYALLKALLPHNHPQHIYRAEPYVLAADVYATEYHLGRAGWSWYTGAAGWYYRTAVEDLLGMQVKNQILSIQPNLPESWQGYTAQWTVPAGGTLKIRVHRTGERAMYHNGVLCPDGISLRHLTGTDNLDVTL